MEYLPIFLTFLFAAGVAGALLGIPALIAPRRLTPVKLEPFECGKDPIAISEGRFPIKFSTVAILFILFDIELFFLWLWRCCSAASAGSASSRCSCSSAS